MTTLTVQNSTIVVASESPTLVPGMSSTQLLALRATALSDLSDASDAIDAAVADMDAIIVLEVQLDGIDAMLADPAYADAEAQLTALRESVVSALTAADKDAVTEEIQSNVALAASLEQVVVGIDATLEADFYSTASLDPPAWSGSTIRRT